MTHKVHQCCYDAVCVLNIQLVLTATELRQTGSSVVVELASCWLGCGAVQAAIGAVLAHTKQVLLRLS